MNMENGNKINVDSLNSYYDIMDSLNSIKNWSIAQ